MRFLLLLGLLCLGLAADAAPRRNVTPLARPPLSTAPCLARCEADFSACEAQPQATMMICPQSRRLCFERCDPAALSTDTSRGLKRTPEELRRKSGPSQQTARQQCRQVCQDRRAVCARDNDRAMCDGATDACYSRCEQPARAKGQGRSPR